MTTDVGQENTTEVRGLKNISSTETTAILHTGNSTALPVALQNAKFEGSHKSSNETVVGSATELAEAQRIINKSDTWSYVIKKGADLLSFFGKVGTIVWAIIKLSGNDDKLTPPPKSKDNA
jgi:hypothetical protein